MLHEGRVRLGIASKTSVEQAGLHLFETFLRANGRDPVQTMCHRARQAAIGIDIPGLRFVEGLSFFQPGG